ncbi:hypothetical protein XELAEV_18034268mg [Xenopus laevis]|uniref:Triacylglycerol lipase n=1 Tax=Xenopus laevis TaxID=8355 RepID=A0A974CDN4_XENLA|nr:hypothetical protein XELAEV_18034268mg [Xenopus laevis]
MCKTMLKVEDVNCFCTDWSGGSRTLYSQAANNIRVVGAELAYFINFLSKNMDYPPSNVHVIGHSLGSHTAGEVGKQVPGLGRITGLDPAGPFFKDTPIEVRLDPTDAVFVDAIHTDTSPLIPKMGYGMSQSVGHMDFFPNGGESMPGCKKPILAKLINIDGLWEGSKDIFACNHLRSYKYYTESITSRDGFVGYPSTSYETFTKGTGFPCPSTGCPLMGHYADLFSRHGTSEHSYFLNTGSEKPYSRWRYRVTVKTTGSLNFLGSIQVALHGDKGSSTGQEIASGFIKPGQTYTAFVDVETNVGRLITVSFTWNKSLINLIPSTVGAEMISVQYGKDGQTYVFCANCWSLISPTLPHYGCYRNNGTVESSPPDYSHTDSVVHIVSDGRIYLPGVNSQRICAIRRQRINSRNARENLHQKFAGVTIFFLKKRAPASKMGASVKKRDASAVSQIFSAKRNGANSPITTHSQDLQCRDKTDAACKNVAFLP